jgi:hypothetical protein
VLNLSSLSSCLAFWFYLTGKTLRTTAFQVCTSDLFFTEALAHPFLCTTFGDVFSQPTSSEFAGFISTQTVGSASRILWHFKQLPRQAGSMSSQVLQRGQDTPVDCPEGAARGHLQFGQISRSIICNRSVGCLLRSVHSLRLRRLLAALPALIDRHGITLLPPVRRE